MTKETIDFAVYLTGHGEDDIKQMYNDWISSPKNRKEKTTDPIRTNMTGDEIMFLVNLVETVAPSKTTLLNKLLKLKLKMATKFNQSKG